MSFRYQLSSVSGLAAAVKSSSAFRPSRWAISARVAFSASDNNNRPLIFARRIRFSAAKYSFLSSSSWFTVPVTYASYFSAQNSVLDPARSAGSDRRFDRSAVFRSFSTCRGLLGQNSSDVDQIIGDYTQSNPSLHAIIAAISTAIQTVPSFEHADPTFAAGPPRLSLAEPPLLL